MPSPAGVGTAGKGERVVALLLSVWDAEAPGRLVIAPANDAETFTPLEPASGVRLVANPRRVFTVHDSAGEVLERHGCIVLALQAKRRIASAEYVCNEAGEVLATKLRLSGDHVYAALWRMRAEPGWDY